jgi:hypothetical protein
MLTVERQSSSNFDLLPVRETFRALRYSFRQNGRLIRRVTKNLRAKVPFSNAAGRVFEEFEGVVKDVDKFASNVGRKLLKGSTPDILATASSLQISDNSKLAKVAYAALSSIVGHLGIREAYVSESAARKAFAKVNERSELRQSETAAALLITLLDEKVVTLPANPSADAASESIPVFALLLWLQSDCDDPFGGEALSAASDLSAALADDVKECAAGRDMNRLASLFEEFSSHV